MASDSSCGPFSFSTSGISHFFPDTQNTTEKVEEKNKRTSTDLGQLQAQEGGVYVTPWRSPCSCRLSQACILRETYTKPLTMLTSSRVG